MTASDEDSGGLHAELEAARRRISEVEAELERLQSELAQSTGSSSVRIALAASHRVRRLIPPGSRRQQSLHTAVSRTHTLVEHGPAALIDRVRRDRQLRRAIGVADSPTARRTQYRRWLALHTPSPETLQAMRAAALAMVDAPVISLVMPVHDPEQSWLEAAIRSVLGQVYPHLELCVADDASTLPHVRSVLEEAGSDPRVRVVYRDRQGGIAAASNSAMAVATGAFVGFIDHDDVLRPHALFAMATHLREHPDADLVYSDEDKLLPGGGLALPAFKPDYSPDRLLAENYINHFTVMRRSLVLEAGGFREGFDGSQDHDLVLRVCERSGGIGHIPDVLYAWRMVEGSRAASAEYKPHAQRAGRRSVEDALRRRGIEARVDFGPSPGLYIPRYSLAGVPSVDVLIVSRTTDGSAEACRASVEDLTTYANRRVTVVDAGARTAAAINAAVRGTTGDHVVTVDSSVRVITPEWLEVMLELSRRDDIGAVGVRLLNPDSTVAHEGIVLGRLGAAATVDQLLRVIKETGAVSGACLMTRRAVFEQAGGMDERFLHSFHDVDYCLRVRELGRRVLCTPLAELTWGAAPRTHAVSGDAADERAFTERWAGADGIQDPYLNSNVLWPNPLSLRLDVKRIVSTT